MFLNLIKVFGLKIIVSLFLSKEPRIEPIFMKQTNTILILFFLFLSMSETKAQKDQIPLESRLEQSSERLLIKIGMIKSNKPAKLKFGNYASENHKGRSVDKNDKNKTLLFSFDLSNQKGETAFVEAVSNVENNDQSNDNKQKDEVSTYITTSIDKEDLWVLLTTKTPETSDFSVQNIFLTNGYDEITFKNVIGEPMGKSEVTAPKGITAFLDGNPLGAMQYYSGGSFSYKKFIWISENSDAQMQLVMAAVFASILEIGDYFAESGFTD